MRFRILSLILTISLLLNLLSACQPSSTPSLADTPTSITPATETPAGTWDGLQDIHAWKGGSDYLLENDQGKLIIQVNKITENAYMEAVFPAIDISWSPYASLTALSDISANITVWLVDSSGKEGRLVGNSANREMAHGTHPMTHRFDFSQTRIDLTRVTAMRIAMNYGSPYCFARVVLSQILLGDRAVSGLGYAPLQDVQITLGDPPLPVHLYPLTKDDDGASWKVEFPTEIVKTAEVKDNQFIYSLTGKEGSGTIHLYGEKNGKTIDLAFDLTISPNNPPVMQPLDDQISAVDTMIELRLTGLDDGDPASDQKLTLTATSSDPAIAVVDTIEHDPTSRWAKIRIKSIQAGTAGITLTLQDDRFASISQSFNLSVYQELNQPPTFDSIASIVILAGSEMRQPITGLSGGEPDQEARITARSDTPALSVSVEDHVLVLRAASDGVGEAQVEVTATDNGGNEQNQGDAETTRVIPVKILLT